MRYFINQPRSPLNRKRPAKQNPLHYQEPYTLCRRYTFFHEECFCEIIITNQYYRKIKFKDISRHQVISVNELVPSQGKHFLQLY